MLGSKSHAIDFDNAGTGKHASGVFVPSSLYSASSVKVFNAAYTVDVICVQEVNSSSSSGGCSVEVDFDDPLEDEELEDSLELELDEESDFVDSDDSTLVDWLELGLD